MTTLYFIRHGETPSNSVHIRQGIYIDDYLDTKGVLQMERLVPIIKELKLDILVTSHLHRAEESAALVNQKLEKPLPVIHDYRLHERNFGSLTGKPIEEWDKLLPGHADMESMQTYDYRPFGGENIEDVRQRSITAILDLVTNYPDKNIGIITHNGVIRMLLFHFPEIPRIYRGKETTKDIANTDIYEWTITDGKIENLKSLLR